MYLYAIVLQLILINTIVFCDGDFGTGLEDQRLFVSSKGVSVSAFTLQYHDFHKIKLKCDKLLFDKTDLEQSLDWASSGRRKIGRILQDQLKSQLKLSKQQMKYQNDFKSSSKDSIDFMKECISRQIVLEDLSVQEGFCRCSLELKPKEFCSVIDMYYSQAFCLDDMSKHLDKSNYCRYLHDYKKPKISRHCSGLIGSQTLYEDFNLYPTAHQSGQHLAKIPDKIVEQEYKLYYLAYKTFKPLNLWANSHIFCANSTLFTPETIDDISGILPQWSPIMYFYRLTWKYRKIPIAVLAERETSEVSASSFSDKNYILIIRDALTTFEAALAATYRLGYSSTDHGVGKIHVGYNVVATHIYAEINYFFDKIFQNSSIRSMKFTIIGEGQLGSGAGGILAALISKKHPVVKQSKEQIQYNFIAFDGGPIGDSNFTQDLSKRVNIRSVVSKQSGLFTHPCKIIPACDSSHVVQTGEVEEYISGFVPLPGKVEFDMRTLNKIPKLWSSPLSSTQISAHSVACATPCWLMSQYCKDDTFSKCDMSQKSCPLLITNATINEKTEL